jgi:hypothetical protein
MTLGNGCCGNVTPAGSDGPGIILMGSEDARRSVSKSESVLVGCDEYSGFELFPKRLCYGVSVHCDDSDSAPTGFLSSSPLTGLVREFPARISLAILLPSI